MSSEGPMNFKVLIRLNNMLSKAEEEKDLRRFLGIRNIVIHKIEYIDRVISVVLNTYKWYVY